MKKFIFVQLASAMLLIVSNIAAAPATAQESPFIPFKLTLVGAHRYVDVQTVAKGLRESGQVEGFYAVRIGDGVIEFTGHYRGSAEGLRADVMSLAAHRFELEHAGQTENDAVIVLRRMVAAPIAPASPPA